MGCRRSKNASQSRSQSQREGRSRSRKSQGEVFGWSLSQSRSRSRKSQGEVFGWSLSQSQSRSQSQGEGKGRSQSHWEGFGQRQSHWEGLDPSPIPFLVSTNHDSFRIRWLAPKHWQRWIPLLRRGCACLFEGQNRRWIPWYWNGYGWIAVCVGQLQLEW